MLDRCWVGARPIVSLCLRARTSQIHNAKQNFNKTRQFGGVGTGWWGSTTAPRLPDQRHTPLCGCHVPPVPQRRAGFSAYPKCVCVIHTATATWSHRSHTRAWQLSVGTEGDLEGVCKDGSALKHEPRGFLPHPNRHKVRCASLHCRRSVDEEMHSRSPRHHAHQTHDVESLGACACCGQIDGLQVRHWYHEG